MIELLDVKYGKTRTEKGEECVEDRLKFKEDQFEEDDKLFLSITEINQRQKELKMSQDEWFVILMLGHLRKRMDDFEYQALRNVSKEGGVDVIENFKKKFKEMKVEGNRKRVSEVLYTESEHICLPETY